jgi:hypothetical protein
MLGTEEIAMTKQTSFIYGHYFCGDTESIQINLLIY